MHRPGVRCWNTSFNTWLQDTGILLKFWDSWRAKSTGDRSKRPANQYWMYAESRALPHLLLHYYIQKWVPRVQLVHFHQDRELWKIQDFITITQTRNKGEIFWCGSLFRCQLSKNRFCPIFNTFPLTFCCVKKWRRYKNLTEVLTIPFSIQNIIKNKVWALLEYSKRCHRPEGNASASLEQSPSANIFFLPIFPPCNSYRKVWAGEWAPFNHLHMWVLLLYRGH